MKFSLSSQASALLIFSTSISASILPSSFYQPHHNPKFQQNQQQNQQQQLLSHPTEPKHLHIAPPPPRPSKLQVVFSSPPSSSPQFEFPSIDGTIHMHSSHHASLPCNTPLKFSVSQRTCAQVPRYIVTDIASQFITDLPLGLFLPPHSFDEDHEEDHGAVTVIESVSDIDGRDGRNYHALAEVRLVSLKEGGEKIDTREWLDLLGLMRKAVLEILTGADVEMRRITSEVVSEIGVRDTRLQGVLGEVRFEASWSFWVVDEHGEWTGCEE